MANAHGPNSPRTSAKALVALTIGSVPECLISAQAQNYATGSIHVGIQLVANLPRNRREKF